MNRKGDNMTRKDYILIAKAIEGVSDTLHPSDDSVSLRRVITALADAFRYDNPRFDAERFTMACLTGREKYLDTIEA